MIELALFWTCCLLVAAGALGATLVKNLFHAALLLGLCLAGVAGLYLFLEAGYLACVQVIVYVGGILVLILFATLFSSDIMGTAQRLPGWIRLTGALGAVLAAAMAWQMARVTMQHAGTLDQRRSAPGGLPDVIDGAAGSIGDLLVGPWLVPFLAIGILLTIALVGAVATVKRYRKPAAATHG